MNIKLDSTIGKVKFNGSEVDKVKFNGAVVWQKVSKQWQTISTDLGYYYSQSGNSISNRADNAYYGTRIPVIPGEQYKIVLKGNRTSISYNPTTGTIRYYFKKQGTSVTDFSSYTQSYDSTTNTTTIEFTAPQGVNYIVWSIFRSNATSGNPTHNNFNSTWDHAEQYM